MNYRHLGKAGIQVSELSFGSWVTFHTQVDVKDTVEMMAAAYDAGVNFSEVNELAGTIGAALGRREDQFIIDACDAVQAGEDTGKWGRGPRALPIGLVDQRQLVPPLAIDGLHRGGIKFVVDLPDQPVQMRGRRAARQDAEKVAPLPRREPRVPVGGHQCTIDDRHRIAALEIASDTPGKADNSRTTAACSASWSMRVSRFNSVDK